MTRKQLAQHLATALPRSSDAIRKAIAAIIIDGSTWRAAAISYGVTESGILKAMQRGRVKELIGDRVNHID